MDLSYPSDLLQEQTRKSILASVYCIDAGEVQTKGASAEIPDSLCEHEVST